MFANKLQTHPEDERTRTENAKIHTHIHLEGKKNENEDIRGKLRVAAIGGKHNCNGLAMLLEGHQLRLHEDANNEIVSWRKKGEDQIRVRT